MRGSCKVVAALLLAGVLTAAPAGAAAPSPAPWDVARSAALTACPATVALRGPDGLPLSRPLPRGTRLLLRVSGEQPNVLVIGAHDLNRTVELVLTSPPTEAAPLLINVDTGLLNDRFTWFVPQVRIIGGGGFDDLLWHFPTAERVLLLGAQPPPGAIFAPFADVRIAPSPPPSPSPSPSLSPLPSPQVSAWSPPPSPSRTAAPPVAPRFGPVTLPAPPAGPASGRRPRQPVPHQADTADNGGTQARAVRAERFPVEGAAARAVLAEGFPAEAAAAHAVLAERFPDEVDCGATPSASPSATPSLAPSWSPDPAVDPEQPIAGAPAGSASPSAETVRTRLAALASRPVTWFGVSLLLVGLALLVWITAGRRALRRNF
ncbi:choice-of-anchor A family protein [Catellatospora sp. NPDC049609]|uniref:collagen-binding domain-containing protein n=1 Tax=Catellatospora sp. NPDC049609 TaxID=3155505 RepID=UPI003432976F